MKKFFSYLILGLSIFFLAACGGNRVDFIHKQAEYDANTFKLSDISIKYQENGKAKTKALTQDMVISNLEELKVAGEHTLTILFKGNRYSTTVKIIKGKLYNIVVTDNGVQKTYKVEHGKTLREILSNFTNTVLGFRDEKGKDISLDDEVKKDLNLVPVYSLVKVTLTIDNDGELTTEEVYRGTKISTIKKPTKLGFVFGYFADEDGNVLSDDYEIKNSIKITVVWQIKVLIYLSPDEFKTVIIDRNKKIGDLEKPEKPGFRFSHYTLNGVKLTDDYEIKQETALHVVFVRQYKIEVDYNYNGIVKNYVVDEGTLVGELTLDPRQGYKIIGYKLNDVYVGGLSPFNSDAKLQVIWEKIINKYQVTIDHGYDSITETREVNEDTTLSELGEFTRAGFVHRGYEVDGIWKNPDFMITKNLTVKLIWALQVNDIDVEIDYNYDGIVRTVTVKEYTKIKDLPFENRPGYTIQKYLINDQEVSGDLTLSVNTKIKLVWEKTKEYVNVTIDYNYDGNTTVKRVEVGTKISELNINTIRIGYRFVGYFIEGNQVPESYAISENVTITLHWEKIVLVTTEYYFENIDNSDFTKDDTKTTKVNHKDGEEVQADIKQFDGFEHDDTNPNAILHVVVSNTNNLLKVYYKRKLFKVEFQKSNGDLIVNYMLKYGATFDNAPNYQDEGEGTFKDVETNLKYQNIDFVGRDYTFKFVKKGNLSEESEENINRYWQGTRGLMWGDLRNKLNEIMHVGLERRSYYEVKHDLTITDQDPDDLTKVIGIYNRVRYEAQWTGGDPWNREHVWPNSRLGVKRVKEGERNIASDLHNLRASEKNINSTRNNYPYVEPDGTPLHTTGYLTSGAHGDYGFYPGDLCKGDVARIIFYMFVMYPSDLILTDEVSKLGKENHSGNYSKPGYMGRFSYLVKWSYQDKVDNFEKRRNNKIHEIQKNRNPFIDVPEFVELAFGDLLDLTGLIQISAKQIDLVWLEDRKYYL